MRNIDFHDIDEGMLRGDWVVHSRVVNRADPDSALARAVALELAEGSLRVTAPGGEVVGRWSVVVDDGVVRRPYLELELGEDRQRALITRLRQTDDRSQARLTLYSAQGIELELERR
jgi:hypothetical protein